jgi:aryl-alcohol dehydrogenase-like predicted oxidoreductase
MSWPRRFSAGQSPLRGGGGGNQPPAGGRADGVCGRHRASNAQIALAWLLAKHPHVIPIPGTRRPDRLAENMAAADLMLSSAELAELDALFHPAQVAGARYPEAGMAGIE